MSFKLGKWFSTVTPYSDPSQRVRPSPSVGSYYIHIGTRGTCVLSTVGKFRLNFTCDDRC